MIGRVNIERFTDKEIKSLSLVRNGKIGFNSVVYRLNDKECLKVFRNSKGLSNLYGMYKVGKLMEYTFETAEMPKRLALIDNKYNGYVLNYIDGPMLEECIDYDFSKILHLYSELIEKATNEISEQGILLVDINAYNILLDKTNNKLKLIDSDTWIINSKKSIGHLKSLNFKNMAQTFSCFALSDLFCDLDMDGDFVDYFETRKNEIEKRKHIKTKTISDMRNIR